MNLVNRVGKYLQAGRSWYTRDVAGITHLVVHHSVTYTQGKTNDQMLAELAQIHWTNGWPGLSYHRVITPDGTVYQINNFNDLTWTDSHNTDAFAVCLVGYFHAPANMMPTQAQLVALKECLDELSTKHPEFPADQDDVWGHRDRWATACPGDTLYPYATEYRTKQGDVNWITASPAPTTPPDCLVPNTPEWRKTYEQMVSSSVKWADTVAYLAAGDPNLTSIETIKSIVGGYKSRETDLSNKLNEAGSIIAVKDQEIANREEQVSRLKADLLEKEKYYLALIDTLNKQLANASQPLQLAQARIGVLEGAVDEAKKAQGIALLEKAEWKKRAEMCESGVVLPKRSWWDIIRDIFK